MRRELGLEREQKKKKSPGGILQSGVKNREQRGGDGEEEEGEGTYLWAWRQPS